MKKKSVILSSIGIVIIAILIIVNPFKKDIWDINAENFKYSLQHISGNVVIDDFSTWTPFEWDTLYSFAPYTTKGEIYKTIGYKWVPISTTVSEEMNQIVFIKDGKVVCYLYGYPEDNKFGFDFGKYEGSHIKLTAPQKLSFKTTISGKNGVRYFNYIK
ncbi:hypothetical protein [Clostridium tagluense]|uniref:hypothetical protein n=1 Tax=Clostridium tagluense TaxID=360422 RepID=UPI001CF21E87|nr:hypothetical protein [Clostridium tagluense]MCB2300565.1 hypothetical protein [Clostridium tagluense]